jgi:CPA2 family monovalent cation:H+ antiporter-2
MLFDPTILFRDPLPILATVLIIVIGKSILAFGIVRLFRMPVGTAIIVAVSLAQVGEFSFILAELGVSLGILPDAGRDFILAGAIVSIILNPVAFWAAERLMARDAPKPATAPSPGDGAAPEQAAPEPGDLPLPTNHTIVIGYGRVGSVIADRYRRLGLPLVVTEDGEEAANAARKAGIYVVEGNAVDPEILQRAGIATARNLHVAIPNSFEAGQVIEQARRANPSLLIAVRAHSDEEADYLKSLGADHVIMGEREIALGMLARFDGEPDPAP